MSNSRKLHIGCGPITPEGWINLDGSWNAWMAKHPFLRWSIGKSRIVSSKKTSIPWNREVLVHDVRKGLPFPDNHFRAIYASHLLEHLYLDEANRLLMECFRTLEPAGVIRLVVPDLRSIIDRYLEEKAKDSSRERDETAGAADRLCASLEMRPLSSHEGSVFYRLYAVLKDFHSHKWMYDADSLSMHLSGVGFQNVLQKTFLDSLIPGIEEVERENRISNGAGFCIEGYKPATDLQDNND